MLAVRVPLPPPVITVCATRCEPLPVLVPAVGRFGRYNLSVLEPVSLPNLNADPLVSIIIPNFNNASFLEEAVVSALMQDYANTEVIVCDDGSTDDSLHLLQRLTSTFPRLTVVTKSNGGQASAVNTAFRSCRGRIVCFLDADDFYYAGKVTRVVQELRAAATAGFLFHRLDRVDRFGRPCGQVPLVPLLPSGWYASHVVTKGSSPIGIPVTSGLCLRREVADRIFPVSERVVYDLDEIIRRLALVTTRAISLDTPLAAYRIHGANFTSSPVAERLKRMLPVYEVIWRETEDYVRSLHGDDASTYPRLEDNIDHLLMMYAIKRTARREAEGNSLWQRIYDNKAFKSWPPSRRYFWLVASRAPAILFDAMVNLYWDSGQLKLQLARASHLFRTR